MAESKNDRRQALELAISSIERQFGKGSVMRLGANGPLEEISVIPTGALSLDAALGIGGPQQQAGRSEAAPPVLPVAATHPTVTAGRHFVTHPYTLPHMRGQNVTTDRALTTP